MLICKFCGAEKPSERSHKSHQSLCKMNPDRNLGKIDYTKKECNNQFSLARKLGLPVPVSNRLGISHPGHPHTQEVKDRLSVMATARGLGGVTQSRWIKYKGFTLGSSYELKVAEDLDLNGIRWTTCGRFDYIDPNGKKRTYTPDFYLPDYDVYLDPKNDFLINNVNPRLGFTDKIKIRLASEQNGIKVLVLDSKQLEWKEIQKLISPDGVNGNIGLL